MSTAPSQHDVKSYLSAVVNRGTQKKIARLYGVTRGDISRRLNPNDEDRKLSLAEQLGEAHAICIADPEAGESLRHYIDGLFEHWLTPARQNTDLCSLACNVDRENSEFVHSLLKNKPPHVQLKEALEIISAAKKVVRELHGEIARKGSQVATYPQRKAASKRIGVRG